MKVAVFDPSTEGGIVDYTNCLFNELGSKADISIFTGTDSRHEIIKASRFNVLKSRTLSSTKTVFGRLTTSVDNFFRIFQVTPLINNFDIIHVEWDPFIPFTLLFLNVCRFLKKKIVWTIHNLYPHESNSMINDYYNKVYKECDALITHTSFDKEQLIKIGIKSENISVIPHGEYGCIYKKYNIKKESAKKKLGLQGKVVLFFGNVRRYKGLDYLIEAMKDVNATLLIAGECEHKDLLIKKLKKSGVRFKTLLKFLDPKGVGLVFSSADVLALPYLNISQSGVLFIGLGYKIPIIASDIAGLSEAVTKNVGLKVAPGDSNALNKAITKMLNGGFKLSRKGYEKELSKYSWKSIAGKTFKLYKKLLNN